MQYRDRLNPWIVVRLLPKMQRIIVGRFHSRSDADGHLKTLRRLIPQASFVVMFDGAIQDTKTETDDEGCEPNYSISQPNKVATVSSKFWAKSGTGN